MARAIVVELGAVDPQPFEVLAVEHEARRALVVGANPVDDLGVESLGLQVDMKPQDDVDGLEAELRGVVVFGSGGGEFSGGAGEGERHVEPIARVGAGTGAAPRGSPEGSPSYGVIWTGWSATVSAPRSTAKRRVEGRKPSATDAPSYRPKGTPSRA